MYLVFCLIIQCYFVKEIKKIFCLEIRINIILILNIISDVTLIAFLSFFLFFLAIGSINLNTRINEYLVQLHNFIAFILQQNFKMRFFNHHHSGGFCLTTLARRVGIGTARGPRVVWNICPNASLTGPPQGSVGCYSGVWTLP